MKEYIMKNIIFMLTLVIAIDVDTVSSNLECSHFKNCGECISYAKKTCYWCLEVDYEGNRCVSKAELKKCKKIYPETKLGTMNFLKDDNFTPVILMRPQHIKIKARPGVKTKFTMSYCNTAKDYPLDIYYLMDNSFSMTKHKEKLVEEGKRIPKLLGLMSNNVLIGLGTFIEKPELPFVQKKNIAYSFTNHLSLTKNTDDFTNAVSNLTAGSNLDDPEAGFDGLMQTMVCKDEIGWRNKSRKLIILTTDNTYHSAGDGKFVGAFKRNDMRCHLKDGLYIESLVYDYPSVSQINKVAFEKGIIIIFAATPNMKDVYTNLTKGIKWSIYTELGNDTNIVEIIKEHYVNLSQAIQLNTLVSEDIKLKLNPNCVKSEQDNCKLKYKEIKNITVDLTIRSCLTKPEFVEISDSQTGAKIVIEVESICSCPCETEGIVKNSPKCYSNGTLECGICKCNENRYGNKCECDVTTSYDKNFMKKCKINGNNTETCSGRGVCSCGLCVSCDKGFSGPFCQYDEQRCKNSKGELCSNHGTCVQGKCECDEEGDWSGAYCNCQNKKCIAPYSNEVCSGRGVCDCGTCICNNNIENGTFLGLYCDNCENCGQSRCTELNKHINEQCQVTETRKVTCKYSYNHTTIVADKEILLTYQKAKWCSHVMENGCSIVYKFKYDLITRKLILIVQDVEDCGQTANIWIAIGASIGSILFIGLLTAIIWKILIDIHDKREYDKFVKESLSANQSSENPLYRNPAVNFTNPTFNASSVD